MKNTTAVLALTLTIILTGCATDQPWISVSAYTMDATYMRDCYGPNAPFRPTDRECTKRREPHTQTGQVQRVTPDREVDPRRADVINWCRRNPGNDRVYCRQN